MWGCWNRQTGQLEVLVSERSYGFKSHIPHHKFDNGSMIDYKTLHSVTQLPPTENDRISEVRQRRKCWVSGIFAQRTTLWGIGGMADTRGLGPRAKA